MSWRDLWKDQMNGKEVEKVSLDGPKKENREREKLRKDSQPKR